MKIFSAVIIDDSKIIRTELKILLKDYENIRIVGEAASVKDAVSIVSEKKPDVIFLDIQLKSETGFDLLEKTDINSKIIFITAFDKYALRAFEVNALDYLLKPINRERLSKAIERLSPLREEDDKVTNKVNYDDVLYLMVNRSLKFIKVDSLQCILAEGKYSFIIYNNGKKALASKTLLEWEKILPEKYFVRIHRSTIVNFKYVQRVKRCKNNTHEVYVGEIKEPFVMSRRHASKLKSVLTW